MIGPFFDTNIVIDWLKNRAAATAELKRHQSVRISRIVWTEIAAGVAGKARGEVIEALSRFEIVELDEAIAAAAAEIRFGSRLKLMDALILATAQVHDAVLITRNIKDFPAGTPGVHFPYIL